MQEGEGKFTLIKKGTSFGWALFFILNIYSLALIRAEKISSAWVSLLSFPYTQ